MSRNQISIDSAEAASLGCICCRYSPNDAIVDRLHNWSAYQPDCPVEGHGWFESNILRAELMKWEPDLSRFEPEVLAELVTGRSLVVTLPGALMEIVARGIRLKENPNVPSVR